MKKLMFLYTFLLAASVVAFFVGFEVGDFKFTATQDYKMYFQSWISIAAMILSLVMLITTLIIYKKTKLKTLRFVPLSLFLSLLSFIPIGYHNAYCKVCSDLSLCGASHNYPTILVLISLVVLLIGYLTNERRLSMDAKGKVLGILIAGIITGFLGMMGIIFYSLSLMEIPEPMPYPENVFNPQGFVFVFTLIFALAVFLYSLNTYKRTHIKTQLVMAIAFLIIALSQLMAAYHIFTCCECHVLECSEFFVMGGLTTLVSIGLLFCSFSSIFAEEMDKGKME